MSLTLNKILVLCALLISAMLQVVMGRICMARLFRYGRRI